MACFYCRHFNSDEEPSSGEGVIASVERQTGQCCLSPDWRPVTGLHYCSQFSPLRAQYVGHFWRSMHQNNEDYLAEQKRRIEAERKLKELRAKMRVEG